jgi:hypothetical protein
MRACIWSAVLYGLCGSGAIAQERFVERTPLPRTQPVHSMEGAGFPTNVSPHAIPSVTARDVGGYVGGGKLFGHSVLARGPLAATGPLADGVYGTDYAGLKVRPNRVFLAASPDPARGPAFARGYRTDGPHVPDVFSLRPFRKALFEKKEAGHK